uniref:EF-hand domain-containing protein n=2 Tax=Ciona intestinalis TaxID=7719 RepID=H2XRF5_CIOIN
VEDILCEMGEERIVQYKNAFAKFDKDSSGIISSKQLRQLLRTLGHNPSDIVLRELVNQVDMDENGKIDFNEFIIMIGYFDKANNEDEDLSNIFRVFDRHERGCIDVEELRNIWNNFLQGMAPVDEFEEMIRVVDNDGNGEINRIELLEILSTR